MINYLINNTNHQINFCKLNKISIISKSIEKINSDKNILLIYDEKISKKIIQNLLNELKLTGCKTFSLKIKGDKINKNEKSLFYIINFLIKNKFTKKSVIISCGGGVVGDISALASSLYLRGLIYYNIPTTMTAVVDSCIGGKTGINYKGIINSLGTYYHPRNIFILEEVISTIPVREYTAGIAEIIKCGLIDDKKILTYLIKNKRYILDRNFRQVTEICKLTLKSKIKFFLKDIYENNSRLILNFGHTFAHAIEMATENEINKDFIRHGEAVALGILCEIYYSNKKKNNIFNYAKTIFENFNLETTLNIKKNKFNEVQLIENIYRNIFFDKKKIGHFPRYISLKKLSRPKIEEMKDFDLINETILKVLFN